MNSKELFISVIIPAANAKEHLKKCLWALRRSDYGAFEIIVVDDNSADETSAVAFDYADVVIRNTETRGPALSRNKGAARARGKILFFIDADVVARDNTIAQVASVFSQNPDASAVFGSYDDAPYCLNFLSQYKNLFHHFVHQNSSIEARTFWSGCGAITKDEFFRLGGFSAAFKLPSIEDVELGCRLAANGRKIILSKEICVTHLKRWDLINTVKTDILQRAVPWTKLSMTHGLCRDLNFKHTDRASGALSCLLFFVLFSLVCGYPVGFLLCIIAAVLICLNHRVYGFFYQKRGPVFCAGAMLFHWFYLMYSSATYAWIYSGCLLRRQERRAVE